MAIHPLGYQFTRASVAEVSPIQAELALGVPALKELGIPI